MPADKDPQREDELSRQRAYGEAPEDGGKEPKPDTDYDRGIRRQERDLQENEDIVSGLKDEKHPNVPETADADHGAKKPEG